MFKPSSTTNRFLYNVTGRPLKRGETIILSVDNAPEFVQKVNIQIESAGGASSYRQFGEFFTADKDYQRINIFQNYIPSGDYPAFTLSHLQAEYGKKPTSYEPYTGGQPAPNPDYPQEIKHTRITSISDTGKNLFNKEKDIADSSEKLTQIATTPKDPQNIYLADGTYTLSVKTTGSLGGKIQVDYYDTAGDFYFIGELTDQVSELTFTCTNLNRINIRTNKVTDIQIEKGEQATTYEPYRGGVYELSKPIDLYGLGDVRDSIEKRDGVWGVMRRTGKVTVDGSDTWNASPSILGLFTCKTKNYSGNIVYTSNDIVCNAFKPIYIDQPNLPDGAIYCAWTSQVVVRYNAAGGDPAAMQQYCANSPIVAVYKLNTPAFEPLPEADQAIFENLHSFSPTTILATQGTQRAEYFVDIQSLLDKKQNKLIAGAGIKLEDKGEQTEISVVPTNVASVYKGVTPNITAPSTIQPLNTSPVFLENISGLEKNSQYLAVVSFGQFDMNDTLAQLSLNSSGVSRNFYITGNAPGSYAIPVKTNGNGIVNIDAYLRPQGDQPITGLTIAHAYIDLNYVGKVDVLRPQMKPSEILRPATRPDAPQVITPGMEVDPDATLEVEQPNDTPSKS